jgi:hypothetical protein
MLSIMRTIQARLLPLALAGSLAFAVSARAEEWVERPFNPPVGSRWIIQSDETTEENRNGSVQTSIVKFTSELTYEERTAEGFRITYVIRNAQSDAHTAAFLGLPAKALENIVVRATVSPSGMPMRIENLDEVQAAARTAIDRLAEGWANRPEVASKVRRLGTAMLISDKERAPKIYLAELPVLALGQDTGLRPGETKAATEEVANPLGGEPIKSNITLRIGRVDSASGDVHYVRTRTIDPGVIKELLNGLAKQIDGENSERMFERISKQLTFAFDSRTEIDVEDGKTSTLRQEETTTISLPAQTLVKRMHKVVTVTGAP